LKKSNPTAHLSVTVPSARAHLSDDTGHVNATCRPNSTAPCAFKGRPFRQHCPKTSSPHPRRECRTPAMCSGHCHSRLLPPQVTAASQRRALLGFAAAGALLIAGRLGSSSGAAVPSLSSATTPRCHPLLLQPSTSEPLR
jgi:hypothetical protein